MKTAFPVSKLLVLACALGLSGLGTRAACRAAEPDEAALRRQILESQAKIDCLVVTYRDSDYPARYPHGYYSHQVTAWKNPDRFRQLIAHGHDRLDWKDDPLQQEAFVVGDHFMRLNAANGTIQLASLAGTNRLPGKLEQSFYLMATGIWPQQRWEPFRPEGEPYALSEVAESSKYQLQPELVSFADVLCHLLQRPGRDRLWLDANRGGTLLRRELLSPETGELMQEIRCEEHVEATPGVWLPMQIREIHFDITAPTAEGRRRIVRNSLVKVLDLHVNAECDHACDFMIPAGALLLSHDDPPRQVGSEGTAHLKKISIWLARYAPDGDREKVHHWWRDPLHALSAGLLMVAVILSKSFAKP
jgi:hypothetical protein